MKFLIALSFVLLGVLISAQNRYDVSSEIEFNMAQEQASAGDTIAWLPGVYFDTRQDIDKDSLVVTADPYGTVLFTGSSRAVINADHTTFSGFQYVGGVIGNLDVIRVYGSDVTVTQVNIQNYTSFKYLRVYEESRRTTISYCNFENRINLDDQNILSILVDNEPGYHKIQHCSFKNFEGTGNDLGIEPIRIGVSSQGNRDSRTLVEYCYFTQCNGDGEIISHKSRQNVYRYNTFEDNPVAELVLRHGDEGIVYGNFFLNNMGGIRIREGSSHFVYNNYFEGLDRRAIYLQNDPSDPLSDIHIYHNTIINSEELRLGSVGSNPPSNVVIANNIFANPLEQLFIEDTGDETWIGNISFGNVGIDLPPEGLVDQDPKLSENSEGFFQPEADSPVVSSAADGYPTIPLYPGMEYDNELFFDLMKESRPVSITDRAIGASEFSSTVNVVPHANELNTGPSYLFDNLVDYLAANITQLYIGKDGDTRNFVVSSNIDWTITSDSEWITIDTESGSGDAKLEITIDANGDNSTRAGIVTIEGGTQSLTINVYQDPGGTVGIIENIENEVVVFPNPSDGPIILSHLPSGSGSLEINVIQQDGRKVSSSQHQIVNNTVDIDLDKLKPGTYLIKIKFIDQNGTGYSEVVRKIVRI